ncbi:MAG: DUF1064 domain-containing protein [Clostridia bacterium]|nr:DUF1064 domain-containing protein [Clostridia bacterium]
MRWRVGNKYKNKKIIVDGVEFASHREAARYRELVLLQRAGKITDLELQKKYELIPAQYEELPTGEYYKRGEKRGQPKTERVCVELAVNYVADFVYKKDGATVVEDSKGCRDTASAGYKVFVIKRKLMLHKYGLKIQEV